MGYPLAREGGDLSDESICSNIIFVLNFSLSNNIGEGMTLVIGGLHYNRVDNLVL